MLQASKMGHYGASVHNKMLLQTLIIYKYRVLIVMRGLAGISTFTPCADVGFDNIGAKVPSSRHWTQGEP